VGDYNYKYDPKFCDMAIAHGKEGGTVVTFASKCGVTRKVIYDWAKAHPEFEEALARMQEESRAWLMKHLQEHLLDSGTVRINGHALNAYLWLAYRESLTSVNSCSTDLPDEYPKATPLRKREILAECVQQHRITLAQADLLSSQIAKEFEEKEGYKFAALCHDIKTVKELPKKLSADVQCPDSPTE